jgi:DNA polymerase (family 10)
MIGGRPPIELDLEAILAAAEQTDTALEVNGGLPRLDMSVDALRHARSSKVTFVLTSDAHHADELERVRYAALNAERAWIPPERVANARGAAELLRWVAP